MKKIKIDINEIIVGEVLSLEEYELSFKRSSSNHSFIKNFIGGRFLKYDNSKDAVIANIIGKNYLEKHGDDALLIFYQRNNNGGDSVCFIDTSALGHSSSILKLEGLDSERYDSDLKKIKETLLLFESSPARITRYFGCGADGYVSPTIKEAGELMSEKFLQSFFPTPVFSASSKSKNTLKLGAIVILPALFAMLIGQGFVSGAEEKIIQESQQLAKERALLQSEVAKLQKDPMLVNKRKYGEITSKRIAI